MVQEILSRHDQTLGENITGINISRHFEPRCDLDLKHSNPILQQKTPAYDAVLSNQVWLQTDQEFRRYKRNSHILVINTFTVTLTLNTMNKFFCMTFWLKMLHNHTTFGDKMFCGSEDIVRTNIH